MTDDMTAEDAVERAFNISTVLSDRAGYNGLDPFTDSMDAQIFVRNLHTAHERLAETANAMDDSTLEAEQAHELVSQDSEAIEGWEWAIENTDNWEEFSTLAQQRLRDRAAAAG